MALIAILFSILFI